MDGSVVRIAPLSYLGKSVSHLPYTLRILLEGAIRHAHTPLVSEEEISALASWKPQGKREEIPFFPTRVLLQDFTGVPSVVDLAAMRNALSEMGGNPLDVNPQVPVDLVIDHSVQVDHSSSAEALGLNISIEYQRNAERYSFLKWGQKNLEDFRVIPPGQGIVHQVNLEWLATCVHQGEEEGVPLLYPDSLVGTDSHTTMINALGVLGWGVGGIEAEAVMMGQPVALLAPDVVGVRLMGTLNPGVTATDLVLLVTERLRQFGVVGKFVEFLGPGSASLPLPDRATLSNMAPEYGATCSFFPVDTVTLQYLRETGRDEGEILRTEQVLRHQGLFRESDAPDPQYSDVVEIDLGTVVPALAGPKRPQDRIPLSHMKTDFINSLTSPFGHQGHGLTLLDDDLAPLREPLPPPTLTHGSIVIAAITSCTNTSNPSVMIAAGLVAQKARERGLSPPPWVKRSLAPGSRVVVDYLQAAGLLEDLEALGFDVVGFGCTTCIGNSGPLAPHIAEEITLQNLITTSVLSGNRNFEGRIHSLVKANYLASPPLVVAYALAGSVGVDLTTEALGNDAEGNPVMLSEIWPTDEEIADHLALALHPSQFVAQYADALHEKKWDSIPSTESPHYPWASDSSYIRRPTFLQDIPPTPPSIGPLVDARALLLLGDSVTTDHISPAGAIPSDSDAGRYLGLIGVEPVDFNSYGSRRGNHEVMVRGTFANIRLRNKLAMGTEGGWTTHLPTQEVMTVHQASMLYQEAKTPLVVLAGCQYGTGSSRDWAAKGTHLLGIKVVIATSYERIHRSNLLGMGVLPLTFPEGESAESLSLDGTEFFSFPHLHGGLSPLGGCRVEARKPNGEMIHFEAIVRLDTPAECEIWRHGGILPYVLRRMKERDS